MLNPIQLEIITALIRAPEGLKYSQARPPSVESDLYNYHLQQLVKKSWIEKRNNFYYLTDTGKILANQIDVKGKFKHFKKFAVIYSVLRQKAGKVEILLETRHRQPLYGDTGIMAGTVLPGEAVTDTASRKLQEETGLASNDFTHVGILRSIRYGSSHELLDDTLFNLCLSDNFTGQLEESNQHGHHFWGSLDQAILAERQSRGYWEELVQIYEKLKDSHYSSIPFFYTEIRREFPNGW